MINKVKSDSSFSEVEKSIFITLKSFFINRSLALVESEISSVFDVLKTHKIVETNPQAGYYYINFELDEVNKIVLYFAESILGRKMPSDDIWKVENFAQDFFTELKKPRQRTIWYGAGFERKFKTYMFKKYHSFLSEDFTFLNDVMGYERTVENDDQDKEKLKRDLLNIVPTLSLSSNEFQQIVETIASCEHGDHETIEILKRIAFLQKEAGEHILSNYLSKGKELKEKGFISALLRGLCVHDFHQVIDKIIELSNDENFGDECFRSLGWLKYSTHGDIQYVFDSIENLPISNIVSKYRLMIFCRLLSEERITEHQKRTIFTRTSELFRTTDKEGIQQAIFYLEPIKGFEKERYELLVILLSQDIRIDYRRYFSEFTNPRYLFEAIKQHYSRLGASANVRPFAEALSHMEQKNSVKFKEVLTELLSHKLAVFRKAASDIILSPSYTTYEVSLLDLNEGQQQIVVDTLLSFPIFFERILPVVLPLSSSKYLSVVEMLYDYCAALVVSYEDKLIEILERELDLTKEVNTEFFQGIETIWKEYKSLLQKKRTVKELDPFLNQNSLLNKYLRIEREVQVERMKSVNENSFFASVAKNVNIIRGCSFKSELNPKITKLNKFSAEHLMDRQYYVNHDQYNQMFWFHNFGKNYE